MKSGACVTAGWDSLPAAAAEGLLAESSSGGAWTIEPTPEPGGLRIATFEFGGVSCSAAAQCMAVGGPAFAEQPGATNGVVAEQKSGARWAVTSVPTPPDEPHGGLFGGLPAVSCVAPANCTAVGSVNNGVGSTVEQLIEHWDGVSWSIQRNPTP